MAYFTRSISQMIDEIFELFLHVPSVGNRAIRNALFLPIYTKLDIIDFIIANHLPRMSCKVQEMREHLMAAVGLGPATGHKYDAHLRWAKAAGRQICKHVKVFDCAKLPLTDNKKSVQG